MHVSNFIYMIWIAILKLLHTFILKFGDLRQVGSCIRAGYLVACQETWKQCLGAEREGCLILFVSSNSRFSKCFSIKTSTSFMKEPVKNQWLRVGSGANSLILENNQTRVRFIVFFLSKILLNFDMKNMISIFTKNFPWEEMAQICQISNFFFPNHQIFMISSSR
jgi:hypothetical protein